MPPLAEASIEDRIRALLAQMTLAEKIGQLSLINGPQGHIPEDFAADLRCGRIGAVLNEVDLPTVTEMQRVAVHESRLGIPLLIGRDVIHGFKTIFPIPLGQAATWSPDLVRQAARISAIEATASGINWTFAPMVDIARDPRWGRVAECLGEDPHLTSVLARAMVRGLQGDDLADPGSLIACAKHFAGYGASEAGKDYNSTFIPEGELRDVHLPAFRAAVEAGVGTLMTSFSDLDGIPASANRFLMTQVLREEWNFAGFVVSDWDAISQLAVHGLTADDAHSAREAAMAGVDMEMASRCYPEHLERLVAAGEVPIERVDAMVANVLRIKLRAGLFDRWSVDPGQRSSPGDPAHLQAALQTARESLVLLQNKPHHHDPLLPLDLDAVGRIAVIGPLADAPREQLGTWVFDGDPALAISPLAALRQAVGGRAEIEEVRALDSSRDRSRARFADAQAAAQRADVALLFVGEDAILSGEAHCRADIGLPGAQEALVRAVASTGTPVVLVVLAGRPLALASIAHLAHAILYAWHPGCMGGPAVVDVLTGAFNPCGKLPISLPRVTGQVPIYYAHRNTGRPATPESFTHIDDIPHEADQVSIGNTSFHLDVWYEPLFAFGHGLSYTRYRYANLRLSTDRVPFGGSVTVSVDVDNVGARAGTEIVQLYLRDPVASRTRPVRELKAFRRVHLEPGERHTVAFELAMSDLAFTGRDMRTTTEPGRFEVWVGRDAGASLHASFELLKPG